LAISVPTGRLPAAATLAAVGALVLLAAGLSSSAARQSIQARFARAKA
jgi:hypothetical protein